MGPFESLSIVSLYNQKKKKNAINMFVFEMHTMICSFFLYFFFQYHETKVECFSSNLRGFEFFIYFFAKFVII